MPYVDLDYIPFDSEALKQATYDGIATPFPGWEPAPGNLETVLVDRMVGMAAHLGVLVTDVGAEMARRNGQTQAGVIAQTAKAATVNTTWTMVDNAGYTIPAGTPVIAEVTGSESLGFFTLQEVLVPAGSTTTATGGVVLTAAVAGSAPNGLGSLTVTPLDNLAFVSSITMTSLIAGGVDEEDPNDYLNRWADEMRLLARHPILPEDFAILARSVAGVWRSTPIDGYNPATGTTNNERFVSVAAIDENGVAVSAPIAAEITALLDAEREINFEFRVIAPTVSTIKVTTSVVSLVGFNPVTVKASVEAALTSYLSPANWGLDPTGRDPHRWRNVTTVRHLELVAQVDRVTGVDYVTSLTFAKGAAALGTADVVLDGVAPLPNPGVLSVSVT